MSRKKKPVTLLKDTGVNKTTRENLKFLEDKYRGSAEQLAKVPEHLDPLARHYYRFLISELEISDLLSNLDKPIIEQTADMLSKIRMCDEIINNEGIMITTVDRYGTETKKEHPMIKTKHTYLQRFQQLSNELGLSPASRASLAALKIQENQEAQDPLLKILKG